MPVHYLVHLSSILLMPLRLWVDKLGRNLKPKVKSLEEGDGKNQARILSIKGLSIWSRQEAKRSQCSELGRPGSSRTALLHDCWDLPLAPAAVLWLMLHIRNGLSIWISTTGLTIRGAWFDSSHRIFWIRLNTVQLPMRSLLDFTVLTCSEICQLCDRVERTFTPSPKCITFGCLYSKNVGRQILECLLYQEGDWSKNRILIIFLTWSLH